MLQPFEGLYQQLQKSPTIDKNVLPAHRKHRFPVLNYVGLEITILGTTGYLHTKLGAGEGRTVQVTVGMVTIIRIQLAGQGARNIYGRNDMYCYQN